jgi:hypothetical protein
MGGQGPIPLLEEAGLLWDWMLILHVAYQILVVCLGQSFFAV